MPEPPQAGRLLVATPMLRDPNFARTVVLVLAHGDDGTIGVVLNRPQPAPLVTALPGWDDLASAPDVLFQGGPVATDEVVCVGRAVAPLPDDAWAPLFDGLGTLDLDRDPALLAPSLVGLRVFVGYAGWGGGQLEGEIALGAWWVVDAQPADALTPDPGGLWRAVLRRQGGDLALAATMPADPSLN